MTEVREGSSDGTVDSQSAADSGSVLALIWHGSGPDLARVWAWSGTVLALMIASVWAVTAGCQTKSQLEHQCDKKCVLVFMHMVDSQSGHFEMQLPMYLNSIALYEVQLSLLPIHWVHCDLIATSNGILCYSSHLKLPVKHSNIDNKSSFSLQEKVYRLINRGVSFVVFLEFCKETFQKALALDPL